MTELSPASDIHQALAQVEASIGESAAAANRPADSVTLLAVTKKKPLSAIEAAWQAGQRAFGENYVDEALAKIQTWQTTHAEREIEWHFIGAIQSRKAAAIATHFDWAHSVDRLKVAKKLSDHRPESSQDLSICIQVNIDNEPSKAGVLPADVAALADEIAELPRLKLRGLMSIPAPRDNKDAQREVFRELADLQKSLAGAHPTLDTLSMGMSQDLDAAIAEGATIVRIGTAIFGARDG